ncbi:transposase, partial [Candidatus Gottesmanbacteria bacterium]|nr:transposase [Candidatus Gottesmanbacteria bacterium]
MPRAPRLLLPLSYYHIMTRGNNKNTIFKKDSDYQKYLELTFKLKEIHPFEIYHYCLIPNHIHFLIKTKKESDFSVFMKRLNLTYFYYYKRNYEWVGHFWQDRFKSQPVGKDEYFTQCGKYIELNPVRAHLVQNPEEYK